MVFRSKHRLNHKVGGQNHLNDDVIFDSGNVWGIAEVGAIQNERLTDIKTIKPFTHKGDADAVHFFLEDFVLNRVWNRVVYYGEKFSGFNIVLTPDFSVFTDMPHALQIFNVYRNRYIGRYWQEMGISVVPSVSWGDEKSFDFCFCGVQSGSAVAISTQGAKDKNRFFEGFGEMVKRVNPSRLLVYGTTRYMDEIRQTGIECLFFKTHFELKNHGRPR